MSNCPDPLTDFARKIGRHEANLRGSRRYHTGGWPRAMPTVS